MIRVLNNKWVTRRKILAIAFLSGSRGMVARLPRSRVAREEAE
jgi:hypothetical protein